MMYGWSNVGNQKAKMGKESLCPSCGIEEETQLHLYHCTNERMLIKDGITTPVFNGFAQAVCTAVHHDPLDPTYVLDAPKHDRQLRINEHLIARPFSEAFIMASGFSYSKTHGYRWQNGCQMKESATQGPT